jgi:inner membrane transporter RhtA
MPAHRTPYGPLGLVLGSVVSVQFGAALAATLFPRVGPLAVVALRLAVAAVALVIGTRGLRLPPRSGLAAPTALGVLMAVMNSSVYAAIDRLPLGVVITLEFLGPLGVALAASRRGRDVLLALVAGCGVALLTGELAGGLTGGPAGHDNLVGIGFALVGAACWAGYILLNAQLGRRPGDGGLAYASVLAAVLVVPVAVARSGTALVQPYVLAVGIGVGLLSSALPYTADRLALRRIGAGSFGVLMSLNPAVAAGAGVLVLGQRLDRVQLLGMLLVVAASTVATVRVARPVPDPPLATISHDHVPDPAGGRVARGERRHGPALDRLRAVTGRHR